LLYHPSSFVASHRATNTTPPSSSNSDNRSDQSILACCVPHTMFGFVFWLWDWSVTVLALLALISIVSYVGMLSLHHTCWYRYSQ
jgi:hypothetical protein